MSLSEVLCRYSAGTLNISPRAGHMNFDISYDLTTIKVRGLLLMAPPLLGHGHRDTETQRQRGRKNGKKGQGRKQGVCLGERQQAAVHHVCLHRDVFFHTLNDDTHQSWADSCIKPAANMQSPAV